MEPKLTELKALLAEVHDLGMAARVLHWDMETHMPPGGAGARAQQISTLERLAHEKFTSDEIGQRLDDLKAYEASLPYDSDDASLVRITRREHERSRRVPAEFVARQAETASLSYRVWVDARPRSDWAQVEPWLERILDLSREYSGYFPNRAHVADPLIDMADPGMTAAEIQKIFTQLRAELVPLVSAITAQPPADDSCLHAYYPSAEQLAVGLEIVQQLGYDLNRGGQALTAHPFMTEFSTDDVRITTRVDEHDLSTGLFGTIHESGHAMYGQGVDHALSRTLLMDGSSQGMHESQSRLWENLVGRSRAFWQYFYPKLQARFSAQLGWMPLDTFYRAVNKVERSLLRTEADEVSYNLHVMLRFDFELQMLEGSLAVRDLPAAWNARMQKDLGVTPPNDSLGVMQDVHWYSGQVGGVFQGYTLGNILSAQFFQAAVRDRPGIPQQIAAGEFRPLLTWLQENLYRHGAKFTAPELVQRVTGGPITIAPYIEYLRHKYGELYAL